MQVRCRSHFRTTGEPHTCVLFSTAVSLSRLGVSESVFEGTVGPKRPSAYSSNDEWPALVPGLVNLTRHDMNCEVQPPSLASLRRHGANTLTSPARSLA